MNSPYMGRFYISQGFRPKTNPQHDGLDLVGQDSKKIHSTVNGTVDMQDGRILQIIIRALVCTFVSTEMMDYIITLDICHSLK